MVHLGRRGEGEIHLSKPVWEGRERVLYQRLIVQQKRDYGGWWSPHVKDPPPRDLAQGLPQQPSLVRRGQESYFPEDQLWAALALLNHLHHHTTTVFLCSLSPLPLSLHTLPVQYERLHPTAPSPIPKCHQSNSCKSCPIYRWYISAFIVLMDVNSKWCFLWRWKSVAWRAFLPSYLGGLCICSFWPDWRLLYCSLQLISLVFTLSIANELPNQLILSGCNARLFLVHAVWIALNCIWIAMLC